MDEFVIHLVPVDGSDDSYWYLQHRSCGWVSNSQYSDNVRSVEDLIRWAKIHRCEIVK